MSSFEIETLESLSTEIVSAEMAIDRPDWRPASQPDSHIAMIVVYGLLWFVYCVC